MIGKRGGVSLNLRSILRKKIQRARQVVEPKM
jgi:hypothetical protein